MEKTKTAIDNANNAIGTYPKRRIPDEIKFSMSMSSKLLVPGLQDSLSVSPKKAGSRRSDSADLSGQTFTTAAANNLEIIEAHSIIGTTNKREARIFPPLKPLEPSQEDETMMTSSNNKEPNKLYMEELNRNLKKFAEYHKKEVDFIKLQQLEPNIMPGSQFLYNRTSQIIGHEIILHENKVWAALTAHTVKQYKNKKAKTFTVTSIELHVFDILDKGKQVAAIEVASSYGRTYPMQTNMTSWKDNIYYFKRQMTFEEKETDEGNLRVESSKRQLTRFNLTDLKESEVEGYSFDEGKERLSVVFMDTKDDNYILYAFQTGTSALQIRKFTNLNEARKKGYQLIYQVYSDVLLVESRTGERIWLKKDPQAKSLAVARKQGFLEPQCDKHECAHNQKKDSNTKECNSTECEKRFLSLQFIATYSTKYRDQYGQKQSVYYAEEKENQHKKTLDIYNLIDLEKPIFSTTYQGDLSGFGGCMKKTIQETGDQTLPLNTLLEFALFHGNTVNTFKYEPMRKELKDQYEFEKPEEKFAGLFTSDLYVQSIKIKDQEYDYMIDYDGCVTLLYYDRFKITPNAAIDLTREIEKKIGSKKRGGKGIFLHQLTGDCCRVETCRKWRSWHDFKSQFVGIINLPSFVVQLPFISAFVHLGEDNLWLTTFKRPERIASQWERIETSHDLGDVQKFILERKKNNIRGIFALNSTYHRVIAEKDKVVAQRSKGAPVSVELQKDSTDNKNITFYVTGDAGKYARVYHAAGHMKGQATSHTHNFFAYYNGSYGFVTKPHQEYLDLEAGTSVYPPKDDQTCLFLVEDELGYFSFGDKVDKINGPYDLTFETVTDSHYKSDFIPFIINKHQAGEFTLCFFNFSNPTEPLITQKLKRSGELARVSNPYLKGKNQRGTRFMVASIFEPFEMQEFELCEDLTGETQPKLTLMAIKSLILSPDMSKVLDDPQMSCIPYFSQYDQQIHGAQLIVLNRENGWKGKYAIHIESSSEETSNIRYNSKLFKFGTSKVFPDNQTKYSEFFTIVQSCIQEQIESSNVFDGTEIAALLKQIHYTQFHMIPFDLDTQILHDNSDLTKGALFTNQELIMCKCKADMFLQNPKSTIEEFANEIEQYDPYLRPLYQGVLSDQAGFDFNFYTILDRAFTQGTYKVQQAVISRIFRMTNRSFSRRILMKSLPDITKMPVPPQEILTFFKSGFSRDENGLILSIEIPIVSDKAPLESVNQYSEFTIKDIPDLEELEDLIVQQLIERKIDEDSTAAPGAVKYNIQHCYLNFVVTILGNKLKFFFDYDTEDESKVERFSHFDLSLLIQDLQDTQRIFLQQACMNIVSLQNREAFPFFLNLMYGYFFGFLTPFLIGIGGFNDAEYGSAGYIFKVILLSIGLITQFFFFYFELIQYWSIGNFKDYISDNSWNIQELPQFFIYFCWYLIHLFFYVNKQTVWTTLLTLVVLIQAMIKVLFFLRLFEGMGSLVQMLITTVTELTNFTIFLFISVFFFMYSFIILGVRFDDPEEPVYPGVMDFVVSFLGSYRTSIGDIQEPDYSKWTENDVGAFNRTVIITAIWLIWLFTSFINLIILLNFLIAVISQVYDQVIATQQFWAYKYKSDFNREYYIVMAYFNKIPEFRCIVQTQDINFELDQGSDAYLGFVRTIKNFINSTFNEMRVDISKQSNKSNAAIGLQIDQYSGEVTSIKKEITDVKSQLSNMLKDIKDQGKTFDNQIQEIIKNIEDGIKE